MTQQWVTNGQGNKHPLLSVNVWDNALEEDQALAAQIGDRSIISLMPPNFPDGFFPHGREAWVEYYLQVLDLVPVKPPYHLIGSSLGGVIALELARELRRRGVDVA
jgi:thioesterase domain-containing protein